MIEALKQVFFGLLWFTLDSVLIFFWLSVLEYIITKARKK